MNSFFAVRVFCCSCTSLIEMHLVVLCNLTKGILIMIKLLDEALSFSFFNNALDLHMDSNHSLVVEELMLNR